MNSKNAGLSHKTDCVFSVGDSVRYSNFECRIVGLTSEFVYLVRLSSSNLPFGLVFSVPFSDVRRYSIGEKVSFLVNGLRVLGSIKSFDCFGHAVVKLLPEFLVGSPIRVFHVPVHSLYSLPY